MRLGCGVRNGGIAGRQRAFDRMDGVERGREREREREADREVKEPNSRPLAASPL